MSKLISGLVVLMSLCAHLSCVSQEPAEARVFYLLRHAEKAENPADPSNPHLSVTGQVRAAQLAKLLEHEPLTAIYSSDYHRTRETVMLLAQQHGLEILSYDPRNLEAFADTLAAMSGRVLIVGHSNTTPTLVGLLGGDPGEPIDDNTEFDRLYLLEAGPEQPV
ncbi:MAG: phosphoglycerate mutase family protein, partial [Saprospiraceae bacterium]|nr:phosphoglycerate mutase family protein [Saprospiraceae bacterium]